MLKSFVLSLAAVGGATANAAAPSAPHPRDLAQRALPGFPPSFGFHLHARQAEDGTVASGNVTGSASATPPPGVTSASASSGNPSSTASSTASFAKATQPPTQDLEDSLSSTEVRSGCEEQCAPWLRVVRDNGWCKVQTVPANGPQPDCGGVDNMEISPQTLCEVRPRRAMGRRLTAEPRRGLYLLTLQRRPRHEGPGD